ncbi:hypothetical protein [Streptomyces sp. NPDC006971]|uniref:dihydrofolate reductase family protein n=1 Tax=Streptomyces sp. NPDC006971 TaxID=3154784 RepID=UPI0033C213DA
MDGVMQSVLSADEDRDGGFDQGGWVLPYVDDTVERFMSEATAGAGALLLGRRTYEIFAATWPYADMGDPAVAAMNAMPKYVASRTLKELPWENSVLLGPDLVEEVGRVKAASESETVVLGSGELLDSLARHDLVAHHTLRQLTRRWEKARQATDPEISPAVDALHELLFAGREARMHVLFGGQLDTTPLGATVREQVSTVVLGRVTTRTWGGLAPQLHPAPKSSTHPGRVHVVQDATAHPTQVLLMTDTEAADWASGGQTGTP